MWVLCDPSKWLPFVGLGFFVSVTESILSASIKCYNNQIYKGERAFYTAERHKHMRGSCFAETIPTPCTLSGLLSLPGSGKVVQSWGLG